MKPLPKLKVGEKIAVVSPSWAGPGTFPLVYELGLKRLRDVFNLEPVEYPTTRVQGTGAERTRDLVAAFQDPDIKAVMATIGGDDQITYIKNLSAEPFVSHPKPFIGFSDNTHFANFLWLNGVPSIYGPSVLTQLAMQSKMDDFTIKYLKLALFESGEFELEASPTYNDIGLNWAEPANLDKQRVHESNEGWYWDGEKSAQGTTWGGCAESIDEILRHNVAIPTLEQFENVVLMLETSEEIPTASYVRRIYRALGERGILAKVKGLMAGRPKAWDFDNQKTAEQKAEYKKEHRDMTVEIVRQYNTTMPIIQNMDFGHTDPQIAMPYGGLIHIDTTSKKIFATY